MNSKSKGSNFERKVAKKLTLWITGKEKPYVIWRSPNSGAMLSTGNNKNLSGDLKSVDKEGEFLTTKYSIECKCGYKEADLFKCIKNKGAIVGFWRQTVYDAGKSNKEPILIFNKSYVGEYIIFRKCFIERNPKLKSKLTKTCSISVKLEDLPEMVIYDFDTFLNLVNYKDIEGGV